MNTAAQSFTGFATELSCAVLVCTRPVYCRWSQDDSSLVIVSTDGEGLVVAARAFVVVDDEDGDSSGRTWSTLARGVHPLDPDGGKCGGRLGERPDDCLRAE